MATICCPDKLINAIYDAVDPAIPWSIALEELRVALAANGATLRISQRSSCSREVLYAAGPIITADGLKLWEERMLNETLPGMPSLGAMVVIDWQTLPMTEAIASLREYDVCTTATLCFDVLDNTALTLNIMRGQRDKQFSGADLTLLKLVGTHFSRAFRLRQKNARSAIIETFQSEAMDLMSVGGVLLGAAGEMITLNETAERLISEKDGLAIIGGRLHATDAKSDRHFQTLIKSVLGDACSNKSFAHSLKREAGRRDLGVVISRRESASLVTGRMESSALVFIRDSSSSMGLDVAIIQQLFSFTRAEANLAIGMAKGMTFEDIEAELNIRHNTVRAHLRSMFVKTEVNRQVELVHLLTNSVASLGQHSRN